MHAGLLSVVVWCSICVCNTAGGSLRVVVRPVIELLLDALTGGSTPASKFAAAHRQSPFLLLQVVDVSSIHRAVAAAHPRQALALTIAHWELTTNTTSLLGSLPATLGQDSISPTAGSLLMLASLTSKAACTVEQPLPDQAMDTWQHATWPTGDTELMCMALVLAADQHLQSFADSFGKNANQSADSNPGKLQQAVSAAAALLTQLAVCASEALGLTADDDDEEDGEPQARFQGLHPAVVGAMATRVFQLSSGKIQAAIALLVASVLPEWELDLSKAGHAGAGPASNGPAAVGPPDRAFPDAEQGQSPSMQGKRARSYRKRRRLPSRSAACFCLLSSAHLTISNSFVSIQASMHGTVGMLAAALQLMRAQQCDCLKSCLCSLAALTGCSNNAQLCCAY